MRSGNRLLSALVGVALVCALTACGSASSSPTGGSPLATELSYLPAGSPVVATITTDPNSAPVKNLSTLLTKFQVASLLTNRLKQQLQKQGVSYDTDIKPLLGNPVAIGTLETTTAAGNKLKGIAVWVTNDASKLNALVTNRSVGDRKVGSHDGATLYQSRSGSTVAVDGATLVAADTQALVTGALDRHANGGGMTVTEYNQQLAGLPSGSLVQVSGNVKALLATPQAAKARLVPWVAAINSYGVTISTTATGLSLDWKVDTTGRRLTPSQLPIAAGSAAPALIAGGAGSFGIRDPAQIVSFIESTLQAVDPNEYGQFVAALGALRSAYGIDATGALGQLTGDLITAGQGQVSQIRAGVSDPASVSKTLAAIQAHIQAFSPKVHMTPVGGGFYLITTPTLTVNVGVVGSQIVAGNTSVAKLRAYAAAPTAPSSGHGAVAFNSSLSQALKLTGGLVKSAQAQLVISELKQFSGWLAATPSALTGDLTLTVK
jgi:Protein of unknown function (DUF3352)